ncbi:MAG TPA: cob(I)yrinic acid a,c-diamide adenosyltransferase [Ruminococcaceae bacterium]|nr:cob(I)yrinic acid a,c-diamide adenosyltransferase [Oscillospiraceae bacterium]
MEKLESIITAFDPDSPEFRREGMIHVYTGDGKGKTTAAIGLCVRASGAEKKVLFSQFLKGRKTAELEPLERLGVEISRTWGVTRFAAEMNEDEREHCRRVVERCFASAYSAICSGKYDLVVLDEIFWAIETGMLKKKILTDLLTQYSFPTELVLTGRGAPQDICQMADYVSEIKSVKHPYERGIPARYGIEF